MQGLERPASPGVTIGRAECDVDLNDPDVSRRHAVVRRVDEGLAIEDLGSTQRHVRERSPHRGDRGDRRRGPHPLRQHRLALGAFLGRRRRRRSQYSGRRGGQRARRLTCVFGGHGESLSACWPEACCCSAPAARRQPPTSAPRVPPRPAARPVRRYDVRARRGGARLAQASAARRGLRRALGASGVVDTDPLTGGLTVVARRDGFLTRAAGDRPRDIAVSYLRGRRAAFGLDSTDIAALELTRRYASESGAVHLWWEQTYRGIPSFDQGLRANVDADGRLINIGGAPRPDLAVDSIVPGVGPREALEAAARSVSASVRPGPAGPSVGPDRRLPSIAATARASCSSATPRTSGLRGACCSSPATAASTTPWWTPRAGGCSIAPAWFTTWRRSRSTITRARRRAARRWARTFRRPG